jgi:glycerate 2-kinase
MRVLIAPDKFAGTLTAVEAAVAMAEGWRRQAPDDELDLAPMSDGGPGFADVLFETQGGQMKHLTVRGPFGDPVPARVLLAGATAYVESAQACGIHLTGGTRAELASTYGVGEMVIAAIEAGAAKVIVGLGGSGSNDGGAGFLAALGGYGDRRMDGGVAALEGLKQVDLSRAREWVEGIDLVAATDVDNQLTGLLGATRTYGPQKGISEVRLPIVDTILSAFAGAIDRKIRLEPGAGAAGGLGYALLVLGGRRVSGFELVSEVVELEKRARKADLVLTGEGAFDFASRSGKVPYGVASVAAATVRPCVAIAGQVLVGAREMRALGVESAYSLVALVGEERAFGDPAGAVADLAARVARTWSR